MVVGLERGWDRSNSVALVGASVSVAGYQCLDFALSRGADRYEPIVWESGGNRDDQYPNPQGSRLLSFNNMYLVS